MSHCPKCRAALQLTQGGPIPLAVCSGCRGIWLSASALAAQTRDELWGALIQAGADHAPHAAAYRTPATTAVPCVSCGQPMQQVHLGPVLVEHCPRCQGVFLDSGELVQLVSLFGPRAQPRRRSSADVAREVAEGLFELLCGSRFS